MTYISRTMAMISHNKIATFFTICFFTSIAASSFGQNKQVGHGDQQWLQYYTELALNDNFTLLTDGGYRWQNGFADQSQYIIRSALAFQPDPNFHLAAGFAFLGFYSDGEVDKTEIRPYQELLFNSSFGKVKFQHRLRAEQRIFNYKDSRETAFNHRFRYRIMLEVPLLSFSSNEKTVSFNIGDEVLVNAGKRIVYNIFDHNRLLIGPSLKFSDQVSISMLYNQIFSTANEPNSHQLNHNLWVGIKHKLGR